MKFFKVLLVTVLTLALCGVPALAETALPEVKVCGSGSVTMQPDMAEISLGVVAEAEDAVGAQQAVNARVEAVRQALADAGVAKEDITLGYMSVYGRYDYSGDTEVLTGYTASHYLTVRTRDLDAAGELIDVALAAGANRLDGVNFIAEDKAAAYARALNLAVQDAHSRAQVVAQAQDAQLGGLVSIEEQADYGYFGYAMMDRAEDASGTGTQLDKGSVTVTATVYTTYELMQ